MKVFACIKPTDWLLFAAAVAVWSGAWALGYQSFVGVTTVVLVPVLLWTARRGR
jgi:hypothetical protein